MNLAKIQETEAHLKALKNRAVASQGPCWKCRFGTGKTDYSSDRTCSHPLVTRGKFDPVTGKVSWDFGQQDKMRWPENLCKPSGELFEYAAWHVIAWRAIPTWIKVVGVILLAFVAIIAIAVIVGPPPK